MAAIEARVEREHGAPLPAPPPPIEIPPQPSIPWSDLLKPPYGSRIAMLLVFNFCQAIGNYGFANWVPTLLIGQGITVTKSLLYSFVIAIAAPVGALVAILYADRVQRKWLIVAAAIGIICFGSAFARLRDPAALIALGVCITLASQTLAVAFHAYQSELFPTPVRAAANGFVYAASRVGAISSGFLIAFLLKDFGVPGVFSGISACMAIVVLSIGLFGPRTNRLRLEQIAH